MGCHQYTYVGPYLVINKLPIYSEEKIRTKISCSGCDKGKKAIGKFCSFCGSEIIKTEESKIVETKVNIYQYMEDTKNVDLFSILDGNYTDTNVNDNVILIPNAVTKVMKEFCLFIDSDTGYLEKEIPDADKSLEMLNIHFEKFLTLITKDKFEFTIKFGIISYYM